MDVEKTLKRAAAGDPDADRRIRSWLANLSNKEARYLDELRQGKEEAEAKDPKARFRADLLEVKTAIDSTPALTGKALEELEKRARNLGTCETVQVLGLRSYRHRLLGEVGAAQGALDEAWALAPKCRDAGDDLNPCEIELSRRQGKLDAALGRLKEGLAKVETALDGYRRLGSPGHSIDGDGVAISIYARAEIRFELGDRAGALADLSACLDRLPVTSAVWSRAQQDLASMLAHTDREGQKRAWDLLHNQRLVLRSRRDTVEWAAFLWTDGQLAIVLGKQRGLDRLQGSLRCFEKLGMPYHYVGVAHDICVHYFPRADKIKAFLDRIKPAPRRAGEEPRDFLGRAFVQDPALGRLFFELYGLVRQCPAPRARVVEAFSRLRDLVSVNARLPPCFLPVG